MILAAVDVIHSLSRQFFESEIYPTMQNFIAALQRWHLPSYAKQFVVWPPLSLIFKGVLSGNCDDFLFHIWRVGARENAPSFLATFQIWLHVLSRRPCGKKRHRLVLTCTQCPAQSLPSCSGADRHFATNSLFNHAVGPMCFETYQLPHLTTCGGEKAFSLCRNLRHLAAEFTLRYLVQTTQDADPRSGKKNPATTEQSTTSKIAPKRNGPHGSPSVRPSTKAIDHASDREALDTVRGRQRPTKSQQDERDGSIRVAASDQKSRRDDCFLCECERWMN